MKTHCYRCGAPLLRPRLRRALCWDCVHLLREAAAGTDVWRPEEAKR